MGLEDNIDNQENTSDDEVNISDDEVNKLLKELFINFQNIISL